MFYLIYKITNKVNGKFYIGCHKTPNKDDGYMGSGKLIKLAIEKYGIENFTKEILFECSTPEEMFDLEREIVVLGEHSYNLKEGGEGGFDYLNDSGLNTSWKDPESRTRKISATAKHKWATDPEYAISLRKQSGVRTENFIDSAKTSFLGKTHSQETKDKIGSAVSKKQRGVGNSQYGTMWITDGLNNMKIQKTQSIPEGWFRGRTVR